MLSDKHFIPGAAFTIAATWSGRHFESDETSKAFPTLQRMVKCAILHVQYIKYEN